MTNETEAETDWERMQRKTPGLYEAIHRISQVRETMERLFDGSATRWDGSNPTDLCDKAMFGLVQLEIEEIRASVQQIEESLEALPPRKGWRLLFRAKDKILYQSPTSEVAEVPIGLADVLTSGVPFEGEVAADGKYLRFSVGGNVGVRVPRSLVLQLRGPPPGAEWEVGGGGAGGGGGRADEPRKEAA